MSATGEFFGMVRRIMLVDDRLTRLDGRMAAMEAQVADQRDRLIRVESILDVAMRAGERRRLERD